MRVPPVLVIANDRNLDHERAHRNVTHLLNRDAHPARRFAQVHHLDLLQVVKVRPTADRDPARCVAFVQLVVGVDKDLAYRRLARELDVDEVGQLAVRLPVRLHRVVAQLLDAEPWTNEWGWGED